MNKAIILFLLAVLYPAFIFAQTGKLKGTVKDSIGNPIEAATIFLKETGTGATSDAHGNYLIENIAPGNYSLAVRIIGYNSVSVTYTIKANETSVLNFTLSPQAHLLNELKVMGTPSVNGMGHLKEAQDGIIYSGKKTEVLVLDSMDANTAQNNPREVLGRIPGSNYSET
jgi:Fe(3+) dicitrate transport protein